MILPIEHSMSQVEKFGKYILLEKLAVGGMAEVYLAKSSGANGVNKFVAIKRILPQFSNNPDFVAMFKEEAKVAINLNHSNIVSIYDFGVETEQFYIVMEFVDGRNLRQIINELKKHNKSLSIDQAAYLIKEAAAGLNHAHRCVDSQTGKPLNITHRDMSPQNIMVSFEGESKVIDFGIAKAENNSGEATQAGTLKGKFSYMSPEQAEGYPIDPRTDVFALGIILWELLANDRLFTGSNESAILRKVRDCQVPSIRKINPMVPPELERIVMKALAKDKNVRYQTAANLHKDLNLFLNTQYPDFSIHDFSQFIKDCFQSSYIEGKEKLIAFSKLNIEELINKNLSFNKNELTTTKNSIKNDALAEASPAFTKIHLEGVRNASINKTPTPQVSNLQKPNFSADRTQITNITQMNRLSNLHSQTQSSSPTIKIAIIASLVVAIFVGYKFLIDDNKTRPKLNASKSTHSAPNQQVNTGLNNSGTIEMAAQAITKLSVNSEPSSARIIIDGVDTGQITPAIVNVTANKNIKISLVKSGYYKYEVEKLFSTPSSMNARLMIAPEMGYINIHIVNGGENSIISINGQRIQETPPINQYAVPANTDIEIEAVNPITHLKDKQIIKVLPNKTQNIQLILGRSSQ